MRETRMAASLTHDLPARAVQRGDEFGGSDAWKPFGHCLPCHIDIDGAAGLYLPPEDRGGIVVDLG